MAFTDFTLEEVVRKFRLRYTAAPLFASFPNAAPPGWLLDSLRRNRPVAFRNEKARSESVVAPVLNALYDLVPPPAAVFSGPRLDVDRDAGLTGECDFVLAACEPLQLLTRPVAAVVVAKQADPDQGIGPCVARMVAVQRFNIAARETASVFGCLTDGEVWQFLRLDSTACQLDPERFHLSDLPRVLGAFVAMFAAHPKLPV